MQELKKILKEIDETIERYGKNPYIDEKVTDLCYGMNITKGIIRKYISGKDTDVPAKDGWIPVERELPPNAKYKGVFCPKYQVMTKYGVTEGWYNPDCESWYVLIWFMTDRYLDSEIDFERGDNPKVIRLSNAVNNVQHILTAWKPIEPYRPERSEEEWPVFKD